MNLKEENKLIKRKCMVKDLTLLDDQVAHGEGHGVPREDVVPAVDVLPIDGEASPRYYCQDTLCIV